MRTLKTLVLAGLAAAVGGLLFAWSGLYSVAATKEHFMPVEWFFEMAMRSSVRTHAYAVTPPDNLDDPAMIERGAGHYEDGCAPCHGAPDAPRNPISRHMMPEPPYLPDEVAAWKPKELYWITLHGIKYAGMPAWPAQRRDDEPWALTAFLLRLDRMGAEEYRRLAFGPVEGDEHSRVTELNGPADETLRYCARCHGRDGNGRDSGAFPRLAGQSADYLYESLRAYAAGTRYSGFMQPAAAGLDDGEMRALAEHFAAQSPVQSPAAGTPGPGEGDEPLLEVGRTIAEDGDPSGGVPACSSCHGRDGNGAAHARDPRYPSLDGQHAGYIEQQLRLWRDGSRGDNALSRIMGAAARRLTDDQIRALSLYYANRPPVRATVEGVGRKS
ncbi:c-type cytochrome [Azospirillum picis]|uniref:Cytochrome c553 n=1 Tax=Azospirillum picis TaxID=488438 RepID=A0ABU0MLT1_9PROT|nr:c-type cytochrome [Azospirillum picis]MBP2301029.1 cytochrome c553 [Azospirillum picis]MDQ0534351.1 cytochrome c553 [Azospirillum picis]